MLTDARATEALFFPMVFKSILEAGGKRDEGYEACLRAIDAAAAEILRHHDMKRRGALFRRVTRLCDQVFEPGRKGGVRVDKVALEAYYLLQATLETGYLELEEGSALAVAIGAILDAFAEAFAEERLNASARKHASKALEGLQREGYFSGVRMAA